MEHQRFDAFARAFAGGVSRRGLLKGFSVFGSAGIFGVEFVRDSSYSAAQTGEGENEGTGCVPPDCSPGQVLSEDQCSCICTIDCPPNFAPDPNSCICYCTLGDFYECPDPALVYDDSACACVCANDDCPGDAVLDSESCRCYCPDTIVCGAGEEPDPVTCECTCVRECAGNQILDDCECVCENDDCDDPFVLDEVACDCVCPPDIGCERTKILDLESCECVCPPDLTCPRLFRLDPETCDCVCSEDDPCSEIHVRDPETCECVCKTVPACENPKVQDPSSCQCVCPQEISCPDGNLPNPDTCSCDCAPGLLKCKDRCVAPCLPTQTLNGDCTCEEIICPPDRPLICACGCPVGMGDCKGQCVPECGPNQVFDWGCQCVCAPNTPCPTRRVLNPETCECVCKETACPPNKEWIPEDCRCVCPRSITCDEGKRLDNETCQCVCRDENCPGAHVLDQETCRCGCPKEISCAEGQSIEPLTCTCVCPDTECPPGQVLDSETCTCACPTNITCAAGQILDPKTCSCTCRRTSCPGKGKLNLETCKCECAETLTCQKGETFNPKVCDCACIPGALLDTVIVPVNGFSAWSTFVLRDGVSYKLRASGTFKTGSPPQDMGDAEYAFDSKNPSVVANARDKCGPSGSVEDYGIAINSGGQLSTKYPRWGTYNANHVYSTNYVGTDSIIALNYHDCITGDNQGSLTVEIFCPNAGDDSGNPGSSGT